MAIFDLETAVGTALEPIARKFSPEMFGAGGLRTIHNDREAAAREGLPGPIAVGPQVAALIFRMLRQSFGRGWFEGGSVEITFKRAVPSDAFCAAGGVVRIREPVSDGTARLRCDVWVETGDGVRAIAGTASGLVFPRPGRR